jgi:hypothetical protein
MRHATRIVHSAALIRGGGWLGMGRPADQLLAHYLFWNHPMALLVAVFADG